MDRSDPPTRETQNGSEPTRARAVEVRSASPAPLGQCTGAAAPEPAPWLRSAGLAAAFLIRVAGNGPSGLRWLQWATPFGWVQHLHPLTRSSPGPLAPLALSVLGLAGASVLLAGRRDVGAGLRPSVGSARARCALLTGPLGLAVRLERPVLLAWAAGVAGLSFLFGLIRR